MVMLIMNIPYFDGYGDYEKNHSDEDIYPSLWPQTGLGSTHAPPKNSFYYHLLLLLLLLLLSLLLLLRALPIPLIKHIN